MSRLRLAGLAALTLLSNSLGCANQRSHSPLNVPQETWPSAEEDSSSKAPPWWTIACGSELATRLVAARAGLTSTDTLIVVGVGTTNPDLEDGLITGLLENGLGVQEKLNVREGEEGWKAPEDEVFYVSPLSPQNLARWRASGVTQFAVYRLLEVDAGATGTSASRSARASAFFRVINPTSGRITFAGELKCSFIPRT